MPLLLLAILTALALLAALSLCVRLGTANRAELIIAVGTTWNLIVLLPIYVLGLLAVLDRANLSWASAGVSLTIIAWAAYGVGAKKLAREVGVTLGVLARSPYDALRITARTRSLLILGVVAILVLVPWEVMSAWYAPTWQDWDALWYHEPIVGFTIQNRSFAPSQTTCGAMVYIFGFPRVCEMTQLWFAIFAGRRLVDIANVIMWPILIASVAALTYRYQRNKASALAWGFALALVPGNWRLLRTTMADPQCGALTLAAVYFASHPVLSTTNVVYAIIAMTLAVGTKSLASAPVALLAVILLVRLLRKTSVLGRRRVRALVAGGAALLGSMLATTHVRNYLNFHNPLFPVFSLDYDGKWFHVHWPYGAPLFGGFGGVAVRNSLDVVLKNALQRPYGPTIGQYSEKIHHWGFGMLWLVLPLGILGLVLGPLYALRGSIRRTSRMDFAVQQAKNFSIVSAAFAIMWYTGGGLEMGRQHIASMGLMMAGVAWLAARGWPRLTDPVITMVQLGSILMAIWCEPPWVVTPSKLSAMMDTPYPEREFKQSFGAPVVEATGLAREKELGAGKVIAYECIAYFALLWNNDYSNQALILSDAEHPLEQAEKANATWIYASPSQRLGQQVRSSSNWELVGPLEVENYGQIYRRIR